MPNNFIASARGIIYASESFRHNERFMIVGDSPHNSPGWIEVKLLDTPGFKSVHREVPRGHAVISEHHACSKNIIEDNRTIMEHVKSVVLSE